MAGSRTQNSPAIPPYPPNKNLYAHRKAVRGWSQKELARRLIASMKTEDGSCVTGDRLDETISRWENGWAWPDENFQKHLVLVFGVSAVELGLLKPDELARLPADFAAPHTRRGDVNDDVVTTQKMEPMEPMVPTTGDSSSVMFRRDVQITEILSALTAVGLASRQPGQLSLDPEDVALVAQNARAHARWYWSWNPQDLVDQALVQLDLGVRMLKPAQADSANFRGLSAAVAHEALLAARLLFFDIGEHDLARRCFAIAGTAVDYALDHRLAVAVYAHQAFVPGFNGDIQETDWLLERAEGCLQRAQAGPLLEAWFRCVAAELYGRTNRPDLGIRSIQQAQDALGRSGEDPSWLDWFSHHRFHGFAGNAYLQAGKYEQATSQLQLALEGLGANAAKQRPVLLFDRALSEAPTDHERSAASVWEGCDALMATPYATAISRLSQLKSALEGTRFAGELEDRVRALPAPAP